ncbi:cyclophilin-like fold protein [Ensifer psoraleae]|uniref:Cyclophilin-like fold protein n=1 Tax=Sinorhizobium psoraleae TaxID=520838 RepID=A0ABT4KQE3_9HYPH|nr:cyclophilin-like fold protein [Sinorhizobium psoraleae]
MSRRRYTTTRRPATSPRCCRSISRSRISNNEKIAYLPRKLNEEARGPFADAAPGDLCYYIPWGNLAFFHGNYSSSSDLIRLGRLDGGVEPLLTRGEFPLRIEYLT